MDLDSIISILFLLAFFVLPTIFKMVMSKKKASIDGQGQPSFFGKIGEQIQKFIKDLEEQARQPDKQYEQQEEVWEALSEEDEIAAYDEVVNPLEPKESLSLEKVFVREQQEDRLKQPSVKEAALKVSVGNTSGAYRMRNNALQNAVVWSEILSKPLALRDE